MSTEIVATLCFGLAVLHTFFSKKLHPKVDLELVFGIWAALFLLFYTVFEGPTAVVRYVDSLSFAEPIFVFVVMAVAATEPILQTAAWAIGHIARILPLPYAVGFYSVTLIAGPLLGSLITEPAAMTVTALLLLSRYFDKTSTKFKYFTVAVLFVNISIGGTLTPFAAPPVLMVSKPWGWDLSFMLEHFGWKAALSCVLSVIGMVVVFRSEFRSLSLSKKVDKFSSALWIVLVHWLALVAVVAFHASIPVFVGAFGLFFVFHRIFCRRDKIDFFHPILVGIFLAGLVILGKPQRWWLEPLLTQLSPGQLFLSAIGLTAVTDNAALTYLGVQVPELGALAEYALVAGAVVGGGLTVIANAPNPVGYGILSPKFGSRGINPLGLFLAALPPTIVAGACFWWL